MELRQLGYFMHLAGTGSVSQSAKALGLSQPSLSRQIQQLEESLQVELFARHHRPMTLTDTGEFLYRHVKQPLNELEQAMALTRRFGDRYQNRLIIGSVASALYGLLPEAISKLRQNLNDLHPNFDIKIIEMNFHEQIIALKSGEIDVGFGRLACQDGAIEQTFLRNEPFVLAVAKWHPLADKQCAVSLSELGEDTLILYHKTANLLPYSLETDLLLQLFERADCQPTNHVRVRDIQVALAMVAASEGITLVPESLQTVRSDQISYLPLTHKHCSSPMYMNTLAHNPIAHLDALQDALLAVYQAHNISTPKLRKARAKAEKK